jgi:hypothetical protein
MFACVLALLPAQINTLRSACQKKTVGLKITNQTFVGLAAGYKLQLFMKP